MGTFHNQEVWDSSLRGHCGVEGGCGGSHIWDVAWGGDSGGGQ